MEKPEIFGLFITAHCSKCGAECPVPFSWDSVKAWHEPAQHLLRCIQEAYVNHLKDDLCRVRNMAVPEDLPGKERL
jgi:hypothetical protein